MVHTPGCFHTTWTAGVVQKLKLFSLMPTLRAHPSSEGERHCWLSGSRALVLYPLACSLIACLKILKFCWRISFLVRGTFKIQHCGFLRVIFMHTKRVKLLRRWKRAVNLQGERAIQAWALFHHLGSDTWKDGRTDSGCWAATPPRSSLPPSSPCCKDSPRVRKKNTILKCFAVAKQLLQKPKRLQSMNWHVHL